jgi:formate dehydrogenase subunit delta
MDIVQLRYMANQIAKNLAAQGEDFAVSATAQHITDFWDPRMKLAILADDPAALDPIARAAVARLRSVVLEARAGIEPACEDLQSST